MTTTSPAVFHTCAALQENGITLPTSLAHVRVAAKCSRTGRLRRVLVTEAVVSLTIDELALDHSLPLEDAAQAPWSFVPRTALLVPWFLPGRPQVHVICRRQRRGTRWLFACPTCGWPTRRVYAVTTEEEVVGCRSCLGLVYPCQTRHRTRLGDAAILHGRCHATRAAAHRARARDERRFSREYGKFAGFLGRPLAFLENTEAVHALYGTGEIYRLPDPDLKWGPGS